MRDGVIIKANFPYNGAEILADIRDVSVDKNLPREQRIAEFVRQIRNPYHFRCGKFTVRAKYANNGVSFEDCLQGIIL